MAAMAGGGQAAPLPPAPHLSQAPLTAATAGSATAAAPTLLPGAAVADAVGQGPGPGGVGLPLPQKADMSPLLQQLNLESIRTRTQDLFNAISAILQSFQTIPQHRWSEVLSQFSMVNVELLNLVEDIKPILRMFVVHPKNVNAENAPILPIMLSSKLLPEMEAEEAALKELILAGISNLPLQTQTEKLQKQIEMVRKACEYAEKALAENRKLYSLGSRQVPAIIPPLDKAQAAKIAEQEKLLRAGVNMGEGLRLLPSERQQPVSLPQHLITALESADSGLPFPGASKGIPIPQPSKVGPVGGTPQQVAAAQILNRNVPSPMLGGTVLDVASASPLQYANSPRSVPPMINEASPQQQQQHSLLQRQKVQQMQKQQQLQQQQQLRQPVTPPIGQTHFQQLQQQQLQQQINVQERHHIQMQIQQHQRVMQQHQQVQQQLQGGTLQQGSQLQQSLGQNQLTQPGQVKQHMGQMGSNPSGSLFGNSQIAANMMPNLGSSIQPQSSILQQRLHLGMGAGGVGLNAAGMGAAGGVGMVGGQAQRTLPSQLLPDPIYNMGLSGSQPAGTLGLPLQQPMVGQSSFNSILNTNQNLNFGQQRQPPPSQ